MNTKITTDGIRSRSVRFCPECGRQMVMRLDGSCVCGWCDYQDDIVDAGADNGVIDWRKDVEGSKKCEVLE